MVKATTPVEMAQPPPWSQWTPAASHFVHHQLAHVSNFWKLLGAAVALKKFYAEEVSEEKSAEKATAEKTDTGNAVVPENVEVADESTSAERALFYAVHVQ